MRHFLALFMRDLRIAWREGGTIVTALGFYLLVITFLPLGLGADHKLLGMIAPGVVWIALLLSALLSMDRIFAHDHDDGSLEVIALGPLPLEFVVLAKALAHWVSVGIPLSIIAPVLGFMLHLDPSAYGVLVLTTLLGTPAVSFIGAIGAALTLGLSRGGLLISLLILPFYIPILIFGVGSVNLAITGPGSFVYPLLILLALTLGSLVLGPIAAAAALRINLQR
ncbi:MAG: heme exporter protein CcmB [Methyloligellaceae bacterium]